MILPLSGEGSQEKVILAEALECLASAFQRVLKLSQGPEESLSKNRVLANRGSTTDRVTTELKCGPKLDLQQKEWAALFSLKITKAHLQPLGRKDTWG